ncbi:MAG: cytochrome c3 family protein [Candidatus Latescibacterota bacterium]|nr:MAG: cytochrome c3 family protein [Candidatus Latescibacterota bacterium]
MVKTARLLGVVAVLVCLPMVAFGGDFHTGTDLVCSDCHVMHYSQSHDYTTDSTGTFTDLATGGPFAKLLRATGNDLCLSCHNANASYADVLYTNTGSGSGDVRQAGALNMAGSGIANTGHTLGSTETAPGSDPSWSNSDGLECVDCHNPHGYNPSGNAYRNLDANPGNYSADESFVSYADTTNVLTADGFVRVVKDYDISQVDFNEPDPTGSAYADFCKGCHTHFHGDKGGSELGGTGGVDWLRHPTNDADIGAVTAGDHSSLTTFTGHTNRVKVMSATGVWSPPASDNTPSCMSCHKAHGNQNPFGLIYMSGTGTVDEEGDGGTESRDLCKQCHTQGD